MSGNIKSGKSEAKPLYLKIREDLLEDLRKNRTQKLPSERDLCERYNVCRPTVQKALSYLIEKNLIIRRKGKGSFLRKGAFDTAHDSVETLMLVVRHDWENWEEDIYFGLSFQGIFNYASNNNLNVQVKKYNESLLYTDLQQDGVVSIWLSPEAVEISAIKQLADTNRKVVVLNRRLEYPGVEWVSSNHQGDGGQIIDYLAGRGCKKIVYLCHKLEEEIYRERNEGMLAACPESISYSGKLYPGKNWREAFRKVFMKALSPESKIDGIIINSQSLMQTVKEILKEPDTPAGVKVVCFSEYPPQVFSCSAVLKQQILKLGQLSAEIAAGKRDANTGLQLDGELISAEN